MEKTLKIQDGVIVLPDELRAIWDGAEVMVRGRGGTITLAVEPGKRRQSVNLAAWKRAAGILKGRRMPNPVIWQRAIRREWERRLS